MRTKLGKEILEEEGQNPEAIQQRFKGPGFPSKSRHIQVSELAKVQAAEAMVQRRDIQLSDYFPGARVPTGQTPLPRPGAVALTRGWKKLRVVDVPEGQTDAPPARNDPPATLAAANPLVSQLKVPTQGLADPSPIVGVEGASSSTPPQATTIPSHIAFIWT